MMKEVYVYCTITHMIGKKRGIPVSPWETEIDAGEYAYIARMRIRQYSKKEERR